MPLVIKFVIAVDHKGINRNIARYRNNIKRKFNKHNAVPCINIQSLSSKFTYYRQPVIRILFEKSP